MRDISSYTGHYMDEGFEHYQVRYRRKKNIEISEAMFSV